MNFYIYTLGDAAFLQNIFNAVGSIFGVTHADAYSTALKIGMLVGVFILVGKAIVAAGRGIQPGTFLMAIILYGTMFSPKTEVYIEDVYSGRVYTVDDVPFGIAAVGSITSTIGITITRWFDQAFSLPHSGSGLSSDGYLNGLDILTGTKQFLANPLSYASANTGQGDIAKSWTNYIQECTLPGIDGGHLNIKNIVGAENVMEALRFNSTVFFTEIYRSSGPKVENCTQAYGMLSSDTEKFLDPAGDALKHIVLGSIAARTASGVDAVTKIDDALDYIGQSSVNARAYMTSALLIPLFENAAQGKYLNDLQFTAANMMNVAIQQRNMQWAADQSVFKNTFRPIYTFIEGMVYAITPLMAVLILMGPIGIGLVGKHLLTLFWIQLWMPLLAVANMFIYISATQRMSAFVESSGQAITSFGGMVTLDQNIATWVSTGSYMAASAPALAGFLIYGSSVALTNIAQRIQGADHVNEKTVSPDTVSAPPVVSMANEWGYNKREGLVSPHAKDYGPSMNLGNDLSNEVVSASDNLKQAMLSHSNLRSRGFSAISSQVNSVDDVTALGQSFRSGEGKVASTLNSMVASLGRNRNFTKQQSDTLAGMLVLGANAGFGEKGIKNLEEKTGKNVDGVGSIFDLLDIGGNPASNDKLLPGSKSGGWDDKGDYGSHATTGPGKRQVNSSKNRKGNGSQDDGPSGSWNVSADGKGMKQNSTQDLMASQLSFGDIRDAAQSNNFSSSFEKAMIADSRNSKTQSWEKRFGIQDANQYASSSANVESASERYSTAQSASSKVGSSYNANPVAAATLLAPYAKELAKAAHQVPGGMAMMRKQMQLNDGLYQNEDQRTASAAYSVLSRHNMPKAAEIVDKALGTSSSDIQPERNNSLVQSGLNVKNAGDRASQDARKHTADRSSLDIATNTPTAVNRAFNDTNMLLGENGSPDLSSNSGGGLPVNGSQNVTGGNGGIDTTGSSGVPTQTVGQLTPPSTSGSISPGISDALQNQVQAHHGESKGNTASRANVQLREQKAEGALAMREQILGNTVPTASLAHEGLALVNNSGEKAIQQLKTSDANAFLQSGGRTLGIQAAKASLSYDDYVNQMKDNPEHTGFMQEYFGHGSAAGEFMYQWAQTGFDTGYLTSDNYSQAYANNLNSTIPEYGRRVDVAAGAFYQALSTAVDPETFNGTVQEVTDQLMEELHYSPKNIAREEARGIKGSNGGSLTEADVEVFAASTMAGVLGQHGTVADLMGADGSIEAKEAALNNYRNSHGENWQNDQEFIDKKFENLWDAAAAGEYAPHYLQQIAAYNEQASDLTTQQRDFLR